MSNMVPVNHVTPSGGSIKINSFAGVEIIEFHDDGTIDIAGAIVIDGLITAQINDGILAQPSYPLVLKHSVTGLAAVGIGVGMKLYVENAAGEIEPCAEIQTEATDVVNGTEDDDVVVLSRRAGTLTEQMRISSLGLFTSKAATFATDDATNAGVTRPLTVTHTTSNPAPGADIGTGILYMTEVDDGTENSMALDAVATDETTGSVDTDFVVSLRTAGAALAQKFRVSSLGVMTVASGVFSGTVGCAALKDTNGVTVFTITATATAVRAATFTPGVSGTNAAFVGSGENTAGLDLRGINGGSAANNGSLRLRNPANDSTVLGIQPVTGGAGQAGLTIEQGKPAYAGTVTSNTVSGQVEFHAADPIITVNCNRLAAAGIVIATQVDSDATMLGVLAAVAGAGQFVLTPIGAAPTGTVKVNYLVINPPV